MKRVKLLTGIMLIVLSGMFCSTAPITGRKQVLLVPDSQMLTMSNEQYAEFMKTHRLSSNTRQVEMIRAVGHRLQAAVEKFLTENGRGNLTKDYKWEFNLIESDEVNAWAMPGGKIVFYTGILPVTKDESGVAVVMGHEIAHVIAQHGNERVSQGLLAQFGGEALSVAFKNKPKETQQLWMSAFGLGAQYGLLLPYSRTHEKEADRIGMIIMALAGYDPSTAVVFWERMSQMNTGAKIPEFLSTHPSDSTRVSLLKEILPEAMKYYRR